MADEYTLFLEYVRTYLYLPDFYLHCGMLVFNGISLGILILAKHKQQGRQVCSEQEREKVSISSPLFWVMIGICLNVAEISVVTAELNGYWIFKHNFQATWIVVDVIRWTFTIIYFVLYWQGWMKAVAGYIAANVEAKSMLCKELN
jgi:hypothetical protein